MISEEHLKHWISEIEWQLNGIYNEINSKKVKMAGINVGETGEAWVSFEYLQEKEATLRKLMHCIVSDMKTDDD